MEQITSAIIAAIVAFITSYLTRYTNITTQSRIDWIQRVREISIEFINSIEISRNRAILQAEKEKNSELFKKLKMYLNPCEKIDKEIIDTANHCLSDPNLIDKFEEQIQAYLKAEWERVKYESKGKKYDDYMFALKYNECRIRINESYMNEGIQNMDHSKFKNFIYKSNNILNFLYKLGAFIFMVVVIVVVFYCIIHHNPYLDICEYLGRKYPSPK